MILDFFDVDTMFVGQKLTILKVRLKRVTLVILGSLEVDQGLKFKIGTLYYHLKRAQT